MRARNTMLLCVGVDGDGLRSAEIGIKPMERVVSVY